MPGIESLLLLERLLSLRAFDTFFFGTAISTPPLAHTPVVGAEHNKLFLLFFGILVWFQQRFQNREPRIGLFLGATAIAVTERLSAF